MQPRKLKHGLESNKRECVYSVYIYHTKRQAKRLPQWEKICTTRSAKRAKTYAKLLYNREIYEHIEIKKRSFSRKEQRFIGETTHVYEENSVSWQSFFKFLNRSNRKKKTD